MYTCGPTVYDRAHIGNFRTMILNDLLKRVFLYNEYRVQHVMNITDVDDKTIRGSKKEGLSLTDFTRKYERLFFEDLLSLGAKMPDILLRATESIPQMISLIKKLIEKKHAYIADDGVYYSIQTFPSYGELAKLQKTKETKARIQADEYDKSNPRDFALWKFYTSEDGDVFWDAPFGKGRPGWHIECSAMSIHSLGPNFDIHTGGSDLIFPHHTNEIAQSEAATGKKFVNFWIHGNMLAMKEGKMSKSLGNVHTLKSLKDEGYDPIQFRYLCLQTHYRKPLAFSFDNLDAAKVAYERVKRKVLELKNENHTGLDKRNEYESLFHSAINDDLNIPKALQIFLDVLHDFNFDIKRKLELLENFDKVLGLGIADMQETLVIASPEVEKYVAEREKLRKAKKWAEADIVRQRILEHGYKVIDTSSGPKIEKV